MFNERENCPVDKIYGVVTTGNNWKFLKYEQSIAYIDKPEYYIADVDKVLGILVKMVSMEA